MSGTQSTLSAKDAESIKHALIGAIPQFAAHIGSDHIAESLIEAFKRLAMATAVDPASDGREA